MEPIAPAAAAPKPIGPSWRQLAAVLLLSTAVACMAAAVGGLFTWNMSASLPRGLYLVLRGRTPERGLTVLLPVPDPVRPLVLARDYLPVGASLLKVVVGLPGDVACVRGASLVVNGRVLGSVLSRDSRGRPLVPTRFCGVLPAGSAFVTTTAPLSFDSRYFGPVRLSALTVVRPLWTF